jgi:cyclopropane fatty-acyl-phospholipid synthase-like methyltransferase
MNKILFDINGRELGSMIYKSNKLIENLENGKNTTLMIENDAKSLLFTLSRYKFVAKLLNGCNTVLEIDSSEGLGARILLQHTVNYTGIERDPIKLMAAEKYNKNTKAQFFLHDHMASSTSSKYDAVFSLDSIEHINPLKEHIYIQNLISNLKINGIAIIGMPSLESQVYASEPSKAGHVNCKTAEDFVALFRKYFHNVFCFSMNDEVVHTGFSRMSNYNFVLSCGVKNES